MGTRIIVRIELTPTAKAHVNEISEQSGMTQVALLSRLVEWFAQQPEAIQSNILGFYPLELKADVARLILKRMAAEGRGVPAGSAS